MALLARVRSVSQGWLGAPALNTAYFHNGVEGDWSDEWIQLCVNRVRDAWALQLSIRPDAWRIDVSPQVDLIEPTNGELVDAKVAGTTPSTQVGTGQQAYNATAVMLLVQLHTDAIVNGKRINGRHYLGPISRFGDNDGTPDAGLMAAGVAYGNKLGDIGLGDGPAHAVWRRPRAARGGEHPLEARDGTFGTVVSVTVPNKYAIMRSRRD